MAPSGSGFDPIAHSPPSFLQGEQSIEPGDSDPALEANELFDISQAILDDVNCSILAILANRRLTTSDIVRFTRLPMTTCYRRLNWLTKRGLVNEEPLRERGHTIKLYSSQLESLNLHYEGQTVSLDLAFSNIPGRVCSTHQELKLSDMVTR